MWIFAPWGLLMPATIPAKHRKGNQSESTLQIRARRAKDLDILRARYMRGTLGETIHTPEKDYEYRAYCEKIDFEIAMDHMIEDIDYSKFKPESIDIYQDWDYHGCLNSLWATILRMMSTPKHQNEYWDSQTKKYTPVKTTGTGYPKAIGSAPASTVPMHRVDLSTPAGTASRFNDPETERYEDWWRSRRESGVDRDVIEPEIVGWEGDSPKPSKSDLDKLMDEISDEIDALLDAQKVHGPIDHSKCKHTNTKNAKSACRAKHRRAIERRLSELHDQMDKSYRDFEKDYGEVVKTVRNPDHEPNAPEDPNEWRGYVWDRDKKYANA